MGNESNIDFLARVKESKRRQDPNPWLGRIRQLEQLTTDLTSKYAALEQKSNEQGERITALERELNLLTTKDTTNDCSMCGHPAQECNCADKVFE